ncbi:MAG: methyltransferase domain-containing protein [Elusimicrobia bacterium]|nr:methyltransferase domain-containing protein [Elusimicrobiota bacterium]
MGGWKDISACRVCGSDALSELLALGEQPLANALKTGPAAPEGRYPLTLLFCRGCSLAQIRETVSKETLFKRYVWVTGTSSTAREFAQVFLKSALRVKPLKPGDLVVEVASNDGTFLKPFGGAGFRIVGVDPAENIAAAAEKAGVPTLPVFWGRETAEEVVRRQGRAKFLFARNVIPHVSELQEVLAGIASCLDEDGVGAVEFHYAGNIQRQLQYDSIYHEHLCYFTLKSFSRLIEDHGLAPIHLDLSPISGGANIVYFAKSSAASSASEAYRSAERREGEQAVNALSSWEEFADACRRHRDAARRMLEEYRGSKVVAFGASARSSTFLNFCGFSGSDIAAVIDNNPFKWGRCTPGSSIPIVPVREGLALEPALIFVLAWNFKDEIVRECRGKGYRGPFLVPFPGEPHLAEAVEVP